MKHPFLLAGLLGIVAILLAVNTKLQLKNHALVPLPPFSEPVLALEFVDSGEKLQALLGPADVRQKNLAIVRKAQNADNFFIAAYTLFLMAFALTIWHQTRQWSYALLIMLGLAVGLSDLFENGAIRILLERIERPDAPLEAIDFKRLHFFAWAKWLGMAVFFIAIAPFLWSKGSPGRILAALGLIGAALGVLAWFSDAWIERYAAAVFAVFPLAVLFCFWYSRRKAVKK